MALFRCKGKKEILSYYGTATSLSHAKSMAYGSAFTFDKYAMFIYGNNSYVYLDAYDKSLVKHSNNGHIIGNYSYTGAATKDYCIVICYNYVDAYNKSFTRTNLSSLPDAKHLGASVSINNYALFGGGNTMTNSVISNTVVVFNNSLTRSFIDPLSSARWKLVAGLVGNYAVFGGGETSNSNISSPNVDAYDTALVHSTAEANNYAETSAAVTSINNHLIFSLGERTKKAADIYDGSLIHTFISDFCGSGNDYRSHGAATTIKNKYALFGGGAYIYNNRATAKTRVDVFDKSLIRSLITDLSLARYNLKAATIDKYALFGGGDNGTDQSLVDVFSLS